MSGTKVQCVAVLGKRNNPLYLRVLQHNEERLKCHYIVHSSLDVVDAKMAANSEGRYLGLLEAQENYKVYGYITCTQTKFIAVFDDVPINESVAKDFFERLYTFYTNTISNPFYVQDKKIVSQSFDRDVINACYLFSK